MLVLLFLEYAIGIAGLGYKGFGCCIAGSVGVINECMTGTAIVVMRTNSHCCCFCCWQGIVIVCINVYLLFWLLLLLVVVTILVLGQQFIGILF